MPQYRFIGEAPETFPYLPADPPARELQPGDLVDCTEEVSHPRLELVGARKKSDSAPAAPSTNPEEAN